VTELPGNYESTARRSTAAVGFLADGTLAQHALTGRVRTNKRNSLVYLYQADGTITESFKKGKPTATVVEMAPKMELANIEDTKKYFLDPYVFDIADDAPIEFDRKMPIDLGRHLVEGSIEWIQFTEAVRRYVSRQAEWDEKGFILTDIRPGDIVGWMKATYGDEVWFHPIRPYESENQAGAPDSFDLVDLPQYNEATQELVLEWVHGGTLEGRSFKIFEWLAASNKSVSTDEALDDVIFANGKRPAGQIAVQSTASRRLYMRRLQKMATLLFMSRLDPYGYNLAEQPNTFPNNPDLKDLIKSAEAMSGDWDAVLRPRDAKGARVDTDILFFPADQVELNEFCNRIARNALRAGVNPTVVFASHFNGVAADMWFNFNVLFEPGPADQNSLMMLLHTMMPRLCPNGLADEADNTLFNRDLQLLVPSNYVDAHGEPRSGRQWVDVYGGFHFLDDHYSGRRYSGSKTRTNSLPTFNTLAYGGKELAGSLLRRYIGWASMDDVLRENIPNRVELDSSEGQ
jgi:hypothetical protein